MEKRGMEKTEANWTRSTKEAQSLLDFLLPKLYVDAAKLSDKEASTLYTIWNDSPPGSKSFNLPPNADSKTVFALKTKGYIAGFGSSIELTDKGRKILVEMVTNEPNALEKKSEISYSRIQEKKANLRQRQSFTKKASSEKEGFNLKNSRTNQGPQS